MTTLWSSKQSVFNKCGIWHCAKGPLPALAAQGYKMQWTQLNAQAPGAPSWAEQVDAALRSGVQRAATALRQACNVDGVLADSPPAPSGQPYQQAHGSQAPVVQLATGVSSTAHKAKRARGRDGDRVIKTTQWCAQAVLVYTPPLAGQAIDQQLTSTAHDYRQQQLGAAAAGLAGTSRASVCIYRHGSREQADEDTLDMVVTALKRVKYAEFGLQLVSFSTHMDSAQACLGESAQTVARSRHQLLRLVNCNFV